MHHFSTSTSSYDESKAFIPESYKIAINPFYYLYMRQLFLSSFLLICFLLLLIGCSRSVDQEEGLYSGLKDQDSMMVWGIRQFT